MFIQKMNTAKNPAQAGTWRMIGTLCTRRSLCEVRCLRQLESRNARRSIRGVGGKRENEKKQTLNFEIT